MTSRQFQTLFSLSLVTADIAAVSLAFILAYRLRVAIPFPAEPVNIASFSAYLGLLSIQVLSVVLVFFFYRLYHLGRAASRVDQFYGIFGGVSIGTLLAVSISSLTLKNSVFEVDYPRAMIIYAWLLAIVLVTLLRVAFYRLRGLVQARGVGQDRALIVGVGEAAMTVLQKIQWSPFLGYKVVGLVNGREGPAEVLGCPVLGEIDELPRLIASHEVDQVIIALPDSSDEEMVRIISLCQNGRVSIKVFPDVFEIMASEVTIDDLGGLPLLNVRDVALRGWKLTLKRAVDLVVSAALLVLLAPFMLLLALLIKLESPGPVFFVQERMGLDARPFPILKFRSMRRDAEAGGPAWTRPDDPRLTRLGRWIRRLSLDELPQFINVLLGDMSLVGPRPEQPAFVGQFRAMVPRYMERHREKAGLTGWAQVNGLRGDTSILERTKYDLWYIENWSVWLDIKIMLRTLLRAFTDRNAY